MKKPLLRPQNKRKRLEWTKKYQNWTFEEWSKVLWSDESKFEVFDSKRRVFVWPSARERASDSCQVSKRKHGGGFLTVWGCFAFENVGDLRRIEGILDKTQYKTILHDHVMATGLRLVGQRFIF